MTAKRFAYFGLAILFCMSCTSTFAVVYPFNIFTSNGLWGVGGSNENDPLLDISVDIINGVGPIAKFKFMNNSNASIGVSITDIYYDDGPLLGIASILNNATAFTQPAVPSELPGANLLDPDFVTSYSEEDEVLQYFSANADAPPYSNGVMSGEWVEITFNLINGFELQDVFDRLDDGNLRIGLHLQGFTDESSESALNVPEPATIVLLGLGSLALIRRRKA